MYSMEPTWLLPEDILKKYEEFCFYNNITEKRIIKLFDAFLLRGRDNRNTRKIEVLQESFEDLQRHIKYSLYKLGSKAEAKIARPHYLSFKYKIFYDSSKNWYTPKEILDTYHQYLRYERSFTTEFIGELALMGVINGKYQPSEGCYHILLPSFVEMMKYHEYSILQYRLLPPSDNSEFLYA